MEQPKPLRRYSLHGLALELRCALPWLAAQIEHGLSGFEEDEWPDGFTPVAGQIDAYDEHTVVKHLSPTATPLSDSQGGLEIYQEQERFWLVDDRWGLTELNMLKGQWRSWLLPRPAIDPELCFESAVLWPMAQLLRGRGLHLLPAVSVVRDNWGMLIVSPCSIEPELRAMISAGFRVIGQRWTALREENGRVDLLHLPGKIERLMIRHRELSQAPDKWLDLESEYCGIRRHHAVCQTVLLIEPGRRGSVNLKQTAFGSSVLRLRQSWPIFELHPQRKVGRMAVKLARSSQCWEVQLSNDPRELLDQLQTLKAGSAAPQRSRVSVAISPRLAVSHPMPVTSLPMPVSSYSQEERRQAV